MTSSRANKKQQAFLKLYEPVHDRFERFCRARVYGRSDYRDLMNETLVVAFQKFETLRSEQVFLSFLFGVAVRILANQRKKKKESSTDQEGTIQFISDPQANTEREAEVSMLYAALARLPEEQSELLILFEITGFKIKEIAEMKQISESAVKQRLKRGREKLAQMLAPELNSTVREVGNGK